MKFFLVDVVCISCTKAWEQFDAAKIEALSEAILECEGLLRPLILKATGPESFEVIDGFLEYWAAVRAREKNPRQGEMVNAFVVAPKSETTILKQVKMLHGVEEVVTPSSVPIELSPQTLHPFKKELESIHLKIEGLMSLPSQLHQLERSVQEKMESLFKQLEGSLELPKKADRKKADMVYDRKVLGKEDYRSKTVHDLKSLAKERGITNISKMKKADLIMALEKHDHWESEAKTG